MFLPPECEFRLGLEEHISYRGIGKAGTREFFALDRCSVFACLPLILSNIEHLYE
jgi:hypothetical protein